MPPHYLRCPPPAAASHAADSEMPQHFYAEETGWLAVTLS